MVFRGHVDLILQHNGDVADLEVGICGVIPSKQRCWHWDAGLGRKLKRLYNLIRVLEIEGMACAQLALNTNFKVYY